MIERGVVDAETLREIALWAVENYTSFRANPNTGGRYALLGERNDAPASIISVQKIVEERFGEFVGLPPASFGDFCGVQKAGCSTHRHRDADGDIRLNVMVQKPLGGGHPVVDGNELQVEEGDAWVCNAGEVFHESRPVVGRRVRVILSFGYSRGSK